MKKVTKEEFKKRLLVDQARRERYKEKELERYFKNRRIKESITKRKKVRK